MYTIVGAPFRQDGKIESAWPKVISTKAEMAMQYRCRSCYNYYADVCECGNRYRFAYNFMADFKGTVLLDQLMNAYSAPDCEHIARALLSDHGLSECAIDKYMNDYMDRGKDAREYLVPWHQVNLAYEQILAR